MRFPKRSRAKFKNVTELRDGLKFQSKAEAGLYDFLKLREEHGEITDIKCQVQVYLTKAKILFKPDFSYVLKETGITEYSEMKGFETAVYRIKRRLWLHYGPGKLLVFKGQFPNLRLTEELVPQCK